MLTQQAKAMLQSISESDVAPNKRKRRCPQQAKRCCNPTSESDVARNKQSDVAIQQAKATLQSNKRNNIHQTEIANTQLKQNENFAIFSILNGEIVAEATDRNLKLKRSQNFHGGE